MDLPVASGAERDALDMIAGEQTDGDHPGSISGHEITDEEIDKGIVDDLDPLSRLNAMKESVEEIAENTSDDTSGDDDGPLTSFGDDEDDEQIDR